MYIGILTFHRAINYGAFLQAFALKVVLENEGHNVEMLDYWPDPHECYYHSINYWLLKELPLKGKIRAIVGGILNSPYTYRKRTKMMLLQQKYLKLSHQVLYKSAKDIHGLKYDAIIFGSDQIWWRSTLPGYKGIDPVYWGHFNTNPNCKKIAYAPSLGKIIFHDEELSFVRESLQVFDTLTVREKDASELLGAIVGYDIPVVADPTLLLARDNWKKYLCKNNKERKYLLFFNLLPSSESEEMAREIARIKGLRMIEITGTVLWARIKKDVLQTLDAFEWMTYIANAEFVVTSSFHGTVFSILFERNFVSLGLGERSNRVKSLLSNLGIDNRLVDESSYKDIIGQKIPYDQVNKRLSIMREKSKSVLFNSLNS